MEMKDYLLELLFDKENVQDIKIRMKAYKQYESNLETLKRISLLSDREFEIITKLEEGSTLEQLGKDLDITRERVRQIENKALLKLKENSTARKLLVYGVDWLELENAKENMKNSILELTKEYNKLVNKYNQLLKDYNLSLENVSDIELNLDNPIEDLELSARPYRCLKISNINTIRQLVSMTRFEVHKIRNMGEKSVKEIEINLKSRGLFLKLEK